MDALSDEQLDSLKSFTKKYGSAIIEWDFNCADCLFWMAILAEERSLAQNQMNTAKVQQLMDEARATQGDAFTALSATAEQNC